jgi:HSP20 family molecular chaperone IbpA
VKEVNEEMNTELSAKEKQEVKGAEGTRPGRWFVPDIDVCETPDSLWLWADMPGVDESSVEVNLREGVLSIEGRVSLKEYDGLRPAYTEYNVGNFSRRMSVSDHIDAERIAARMSNGVLELQLPKSERVKPRRIPVTAG